jgi:predicted nucleic acid-binding protein
MDRSPETAPQLLEGLVAGVEIQHETPSYPRKTDVVTMTGTVQGIKWRLEVHPTARLDDLVQLSRRWFDEVVANAAEDQAAACRWLERLSPRPITYADAVSFAVIEGPGCRHVLGFDQDFAIAGFTLWRGLG